MAETLMSRTFEYRQRWGRAAEPMPLVERTRILNERLRLHDSVGEQIDATQDAISELLNGLVKSHIESGMIRTGTTLKDAIKVIVDSSERLVDSLANGVAEESRTPEAFKVIEEALSRFFEFLELELKRIIDKVKFELQDQTKSMRFQEAAQRMWSGERAGIETKLEHIRASFIAAGYVETADPAVASGEMESGDMQAEPLKVVTGQDGAEEAGIREEEDSAIQTEAAQPEAEQPEADHRQTDDQPDERLEAEPSESVRASEGIVLQGQPVTQITIDLDPPVPSPAPEAAQLSDETAARTMWSNLVVDIWSGRTRPRSQADWREAIRTVCQRLSIDPASVGMEECARQLWWNTVASQHVLSTVRSTITSQSSARTFGTFGASEKAISRSLFSATGQTSEDHADRLASDLSGYMTLEAPAVDIC